MISLDVGDAVTRQVSSERHCQIVAQRQHFSTLDNRAGQVSVCRRGQQDKCAEPNLICQVVNELRVLAILVREGFFQLEYRGVNAHGTVTTEHLTSRNETSTATEREVSLRYAPKEE